MADKDFTVADVLAWARTKPADEGYNFLDSRNCALCMFLRETGRIAEPWVDPDEYGDARKPKSGRPLPDWANDAVQGTGEEVWLDDRWSFGRLVKRLEKLCPETPITSRNWAAVDAYLLDIEQVLA